MKTRSGLSTLLAILFLVFGGLVPAAMFGQSGVMGTNDLANYADVVAIGKVAATKSEWNADRTRILTRVTITVREYLKGGAAGQQLTLVTPGGEIGDEGELYSGAARFKQEEDVVVFAKASAGREMLVAGGAQGKVTVTRDGSTGVMTVDLGMKLDDFRAQVKSAIHATSPEGR